MLESSKKVFQNLDDKTLINLDEFKIVIAEKGLNPSKFFGKMYFDPAQYKRVKSEDDENNIN